MINIENKKNDLPKEIFDINFYNEISFKILNCLDDSFKECSDLLKLNNKNKYNNLVAIYYHHLTQLLCSYYFVKFEYSILNVNHNIYRKYFINNRCDWPINYNSVSNDLFDSDKYYFKNKKNIKKKIFNLINRIVSFSPKYKLMFLDNVSGLNKFSLSLNSIYIENQPLDLRFEYIEGIKQWNILEKNIRLLNNNLIKIFNKNISFSEFFLNFLKKEFFKYHNSGSSITIKSDILVTGTLAQLSARIIAANAKLKNKKIISIFHGESIGDIDEPIFCKVEQEYCDYLIGYGELGCRDFLTGGDNLFNITPEVIKRDSKRVRYLYKDKNIIKINKNKLNTIMYVPTSYSGTHRYGPYREYNDLAYMYWQDSMLEQFKGTFKPKRILKKIHLKERISQKLNPNYIEIVQKKDFYKIIDKADVFIFDYPTSAFALAAATNKPIVFFNIGLRNLTENALDSIKKRCIYISGNPLSVKEMVKESYDNFHIDCMNNYTEKYSITNKKINLELAISNLINKII